MISSNRQLKKKIGQRKAVEGARRQSEQHDLRLLAESQLLQGQLRQLSRRTLRVQEAERKRISRELHGIVTQLLSGINVRLANLKVEVAANAKGLGQKIAYTQRLVEKSVDNVHRLARELRPAVLDDLGLIPALHSLLKELTKETGLQVSFTASAGLEELSHARRAVFYRVAQEALANVARHAHSTRVEVSIRRLPGAALMRIQDDGKAFDVAHLLQAGKSQCLGLLGMRERLEMVGGQLAVESAPGKGTTVIAQIPLAKGRKEHV